MADRGSLKDRPKPALKPVPMVVIEPKTRKQYTRGKFLGKGGFARCYELIDDSSKIIYAGKVVSKSLLQKKHQKDKMAQEITIHQTLNHTNVVRFECFFEDCDNVYILLELCARRSLMELHKRRKAVTEPEARYFTYQVVQACQYLHDRKIIHRDLKLGNLFLNDDMQVKIGDFGLATTLEYDGERKKTLCGTPNYIAPEMLDKKGHSFEVDIWAIGCILYTLLVGKPPFETETLKDTYNRIKNNQYTVPPKIGNDAKHLISKLLAPDPAKRPTIHEILKYPFFTNGFLPHKLPTSCLTMAPKFNTSIVSGGHGPTPYVDASNLHHLNNQINRFGNAARPGRPLATVPEKGVMLTEHQIIQDATSIIVTEKNPGEEGNVPSDYYLQDLYGQLSSLINSKPMEQMNQNDIDESEDPASVPVYWISKWVDYSDKYGLGYQLCDNAVGVIFNDSTKVMLDRAGEQIQYTERNNTEHYYVMNNYPQDLEKKVTLLKYFRSYMNEHLLKTGADMAVREGDELARLPYLNVWFRTSAAIVLHLSNGTLQINFFQDHSKLIVCPLMGAATYIDSQRRFRTFKLTLLEKLGCPKDLYSRLRYAKTMVERLLSRSSSSAPNALSTANMRSISAGTASSALKVSSMQF